MGISSEKNAAEIGRHFEVFLKSVPIFFIDFWHCFSSYNERHNVRVEGSSSFCSQVKSPRAEDEGFYRSVLLKSESN